MKRILLFLLLAACAPEPTTGQAVVRRSFGLLGSIAVLSDAPGEVLLLTLGADRSLKSTHLQTGKNIKQAQPAAGNRYLIVLAQGDAEERPSLSIVDGEAASLAWRYELPIPRDSLALDPEGRYAIVYAAGATGALVDNPNELLLVDLESEPSLENPRTLSLRSFGGRPQRFTFTQSLNLPGGPRRLLVVETEKDLAIVDLSHPERSELTVRLETQTGVLIPAGLLADEGDPLRDDDARIAAKVGNDNSVLLLDLVPDADRDFSVRTNLVDVGGPPTHLSFLDTDAGHTLVALVPTLKRAALVTPETGVLQALALPSAYSSLVFVEGNALLIGDGVALWSLDLATGRPFASIETLQLSSKIKAVHDLPNRPGKKLLVGDQNAFFVLDLAVREVSPLVTQNAQLGFSLGQDQLWVFQQGGKQLSSVGLDTLRPRSFLVDRAISAAYELGSALVLLHSETLLGATVLDAYDTDEKNARLYQGLNLGDIR